MTDPPRWDDVERIFEIVVKRPEGERPALLDAQCGQDRELRKQVETLLRADRSAGRFLESTIALAAALTADLRRRSPRERGSGREVDPASPPPEPPGDGTAGS